MKFIAALGFILGAAFWAMLLIQICLAAAF